MLLDPARLGRQSRRAAGLALRSAQAPIRKGWRRWVVERGTDDTAAATARRCLVVAPHPDDETIGCGATIARKRAAGTEVEVVVVTDGRHSHQSALVPPRELARRRRAESLAACALLGVEERHVRFLGFEELTLDRCFDELANTLAQLIDEVAPDEVLVTSERDWHADHRMAHRATQLAVERTRGEPLLLAYPVWSWADGPWTTHPTAGLGQHLGDLLPDLFEGLSLPAARLVSTEGFAERKREAFACYLSQLHNLTGEDSWATFPEGWLDPFTAGWEVFLPVPPSAEVPSGSDSADVTEEGPPLPLVEEVLDRFEDDRALGAVIGTTSTSGAARQGVDLESAMGIDNGALRLTPLRTLGWARQGLAYGPFRRRPGLALAVSSLNSHHAAQTNVLHAGRRATLRRALAEFPNGRITQLQIRDNLAIGFQAEPVPAEPRGAGAGFVLRSAGVVNGELTARVGTGQLRVHAGIEELPITYVVALRERGAVYYASSLPGAAGLGAYPTMRPVGVDRADASPFVWASLQQAVHGEVGHELASRVESVRVRDVPSLSTGAGTATAADSLQGSGPLGEPQVGGAWRALEGVLERTGAGAAGGDEGGCALVELDEPAGLVHVVVETAARLADSGRAGLLWRASPDGGEGWRVTLWSDQAELAVGTAGAWEVVTTAATHLPAATERSLQVLDDGRAMGVHLDGGLLFDRWFEDERHAGGRGVGILVGPGEHVRLRDFEAHPVAVPLPVELDPGPPWSPEGGTVRARDDFAGQAGELAGASVARGGPAWQRTFGLGHFDLTGAGALRARASRAAPNPGRTCYTLAWPEPGFVDLGVTVRPPGTGRGQGHASRAGLVLWESDDTHLIVNAWLDDSPDHDGSAISLFFRDQGYERLYDAPWANVGRRVRWGQPFRLRLVSDGQHVLVHLDGEPVLYRRATDLYPTSPGVRIERVGLVANYEWGDDTGSEFRDFVARGR
ncbi:MAG: hypothetical protein GEV08_16080 [Acidimicrobiia bacterium]|nr:hypothetical protein [Acidimicrobiia bacterium]